MLKLKIQTLHPEAVLPAYAHPGDAGLDLCAIAALTLEPGIPQQVSTGLAIELPPDTEAQIRPRSGLALHHGITVLNSPGTIDAGYRGEIAVILINHGRESFAIAPGMRIAQMVIQPIVRVEIEVVTSLAPSVRAEGGFGSTGR